MLKKLIAALNLKEGFFMQRIKEMAEKASVTVMDTPSTGSPSTLKRPADASDDTDRPVKVSKKGKKKKGQPTKLGQSEGFKRKIALLASYNGTGYYGVQINGDFPTIEKDLFAALITVGAIPEDHAKFPSKMWFQRGSRTDKGVSAVGQTFSLKALLVPDLVEKVNEQLPEKIRVMGFIRTTNGFDSKNFCCGRTYTYMAPTFAFAPIEKFITDEFRVEYAAIEKVRETLKKFLGTHNFHNFTSGTKYEQDSAKRYITAFECSDPYVQEGLEFVTITVKGQSFMLHQIRKMIGLTIAIVRGYCGESTLGKSWGPDKVDIPKAPGLGLVLEELHFDGYNKKFGCDGIHDPIDWGPYRERMAEFKKEYILSEIISQEKTDRVMFNWMRTLQYHNFGEPRPEIPDKPWSYALNNHLAKNAPPVPGPESAPSSSLPVSSPDAASALTSSEPEPPSSDPSPPQLQTTPDSPQDQEFFAATEPPTVNSDPVTTLTEEKEQKGLLQEPSNVKVNSTGNAETGGEDSRPLIEAESNVDSAVTSTTQSQKRPLSEQQELIFSRQNKASLQ